MSSLSSIASSGLQAAQLRLDASANNVANMNTANYRRQMVRLEAAADSAGVRATVQAVAFFFHEKAWERAGRRAASTSPAPSPGGSPAAVQGA